MNHPEVDWIESTGYPSWNQDVTDIVNCDECGTELYVSYDKIYEDETHTNLCKNCLLMLHLKE